MLALTASPSVAITSSLPGVSPAVNVNDTEVAFAGTLTLAGAVPTLPASTVIVAPATGAGRSNVTVSSTVPP